MAEPSVTAELGTLSRFITFRAGGDRYALPATEVTEVIRVPAVARLPQGPKSLLGLANLRGAVIPVASLRGVLGRDEAEAVLEGRALVLTGLSPVALVVDAVEALVLVAGDRIETDQAQLAAGPGELLKGTFADGEGGAVKILDIQPLLAAAFVQRARGHRDARPDAGGASPVEAQAAQGKLVTFEVAGQELAFDLDAVSEIVPLPAGVAIVPGSDALVLGVAGYRDRLLPLLSLGRLLGFSEAAAATGREQVVVMRVGGAPVGLVVDRMRAILPADASLIEPAPAVLAARTGGESRIKAIYRGEGGRRLISILAPDQLFREDVMARLGDVADIGQEAAVDTDQGTIRRFVVFRLGDEEFGLPIEAVEEVARVPDRVTRVPRTPDFLEGVMNLRGEVLPVVDQRRRFDMQALEDGARRRLVVVRSDRHRAGLIVDSVSEVVEVREEFIEPAPDLTGENGRLVDGVANLAGGSRIVLLLNPNELLTRTEQGLLDAFTAEQAAV